MTAHEIVGHTRTCRKHGQYIDSGRHCPVCEGIQKPVRSYPAAWERALHVDQELLRRPPGSRTDADGEPSE